MFVADVCVLLFDTNLILLLGKHIDSLKERLHLQSCSGYIVLDIVNHVE